MELVWFVESHRELDGAWGGWENRKKDKSGEADFGLVGPAAQICNAS